VVRRQRPRLHVDASPHLLRRADENADDTGVRGLKEQAALNVGGRVVDESDLAPQHASGHQAIGDDAVQPQRVPALRWRRRRQRCVARRAPGRIQVAEDELHAQVWIVGVV
jgi:hypothetical protein